MSITKKHFEGIAKVINENCLFEHDNKQILVNAFCNYLKTQNKNFDSFKFYNACMKSQYKKSDELCDIRNKIYISDEDKLMRDNNINWTQSEIIKK